MPLSKRLLHDHLILTREQLRELENLLTSKGFTQSKLTQALGGNESNQTYASQIISMIRRSTLGEEISSVEERYQRGLNKILKQRAWTRKIESNGWHV